MNCSLWSIVTMLSFHFHSDLLHVYGITITLMKRFLVSLCIVPTESWLKSEQLHMPAETLPLREKGRNRSFSGMPSDITSYIITKARADPEMHIPHFTQDLLSSFETSQILDFVLSLCSWKNPSNVPNWTDFNYLIHEKGNTEPIHAVTYLPAIDQLPTIFPTLFLSSCYNLKKRLKS